MEPHLDRTDYWSRENTINKGGTVDGTLDQASYLTTMADNSRAGEPIRRYILADDIKGSSRTEGRDAPSNSCKKQNKRAKPQHRK